MEEGIKKGMKEGMEKGMEKGMEESRKLVKSAKIDIATKLLKKGKSIEEIIELTDLEKEDIEKINLKN